MLVYMMYYGSLLFVQFFFFFSFFSFSKIIRSLINPTGLPYFCHWAYKKVELPESRGNLFEWIGSIIGSDKLTQHCHFICLQVRFFFFFFFFCTITSTCCWVCSIFLYHWYPMTCLLRCNLLGEALLTLHPYISSPLLIWCECNYRTPYLYFV